MKVWFVLLMKGIVVFTIGPLPYDVKTCNEITDIISRDVVQGPWDEDPQVRRLGIVRRCLEQETRPELDKPLGDPA